MQLEDIILGYNSGLSNWDEATNPNAAQGFWTNTEEGVVIHKIDLATAASISSRVKYSLSPFALVMPGVDFVSYVLACLAIESTLDPLCQNGNIGVNALGVPRSNPDNNPMLYDMGIAQLKLEYITAPGVTDHTSALAFALDINRAIPYFVTEMAGRIKWAQQVIKDNTSSAPDARLTASAPLLATGAYNFGEEGMLEDYYEKGLFPSHCQNVIDLTNYFDSKRGVTTPFFPADFASAA